MKLCYAGPLFRYERPQAGRYRQFQQVGIEAIGIDDPALDAEVIAVGDAGLPRARPRPGAAAAQLAGRRRVPARLPRALQAVPARARPRRGHPGARRAQPAAGARRQAARGAALLADAPLMVDHLCDACKAHYERVRALARRARRDVRRDPRLVRGLDYYTRTTFEFVHDGLGAQSGIGGGGRYDGLMARARRPGAARHRVRPRRRPDGAGRAGRGRGCRRQPRRGVRRAAGRARAGPLVAIAGELRPRGSGRTWSYGGKSMKGASRPRTSPAPGFALVLGERDLEAGVIG